MNTLNKYASEEDHTAYNPNQKIFLMKSGNFEIGMNYSTDTSFSNIDNILAVKNLSPENQTRAEELCNNHSFRIGDLEREFSESDLEENESILTTQFKGLKN